MWPTSGTGSITSLLLLLFSKPIDNTGEHVKKVHLVVVKETWKRNEENSPLLLFLLVGSTAAAVAANTSGNDQDASNNSNGNQQSLVVHCKRRTWKRCI